MWSGGGTSIQVISADYYGRSGYPKQILTYKDYKTNCRKGFKRNLVSVYRCFRRVGKSVLCITPLYFKKATFQAEEKIREELGPGYDNKFKDADLLIISGAGTLKYDVRLDFGPYYKVISEYAEKNNVPVVINAVGVESKFKEKDYRCFEFSKTT